MILDLWSLFDRKSKVIRESLSSTRTVSWAKDVALRALRWR